MIYKKYKHLKHKKNKHLSQVTLCSATLLSLLVVGTSVHADENSTNLVGEASVTDIGLNSETNKVDEINKDQSNQDLTSTDPEKPVEPTDPTDPEKPVEPTDPTNPEKPVEPTDPTEPEKPVSPQKPKPEKPTPAKPKPKPKPSKTQASASISEVTSITYSNYYSDRVPVYSTSNYNLQDMGLIYNASTAKNQAKFNKTDIAVPALIKINTSTVEGFIKSIAPRISQLAGQNDLYASLIIAQAILESGYGQSNIALNAHNLFNIIGSFNGQSITVSSGTYRAYETYDQSLVDYIHLMLHGTTWNSKIYAGSWKTNSKSVEEAARALQGIFATDPSYAEKLIKIINEYNLTQYDDIKNISTGLEIKPAPASPVLTALPSNLKFPEYNGKQYPGADSYAWGNCTQYVYNRIFQLGGKIGQYMGNGGVWGSNATQQGYYTTTIPQVGYAVSFPPGVAGASAEYGHVAFVERVNKDGSILVSEMNVKGLNVVDYRTISASDASLSTYIQPK